MAKHEFSGSCDPTRMPSAMQTFSVGIYEMIQKNSRAGYKRSAVKVRVSGPTSMVLEVHAKAAEIAAQLDAGTYAGPKNVRVK